MHTMVVITTAQLHSTKPELKFCTGSSPACSVPEICHDENLWQWSLLERRLNTFRWSTILQKQFIIIFVITFSILVFTAKTVLCYIVCVLYLVSVFMLFLQQVSSKRLNFVSRDIWHSVNFVLNMKLFWYMFSVYASLTLLLSVK